MALILPVAGYFLVRLAGLIAVRRTLPAKESGNSANKVGTV